MTEFKSQTKFRAFFAPIRVSPFVTDGVQTCTISGVDDEGTRLEEVIKASFEKGVPIRFEHEVRKLPTEPPPPPAEPSIYKIGDPPGVEPPCEKGGDCSWVWDGDEPESDLYCENCYRSRNWELKERDEGCSPETAGDAAGVETQDRDGHPGGSDPVVLGGAPAQDGDPGADHERPVPGRAALGGAPSSVGEVQGRDHQQGENAGPPAVNPTLRDELERALDPVLKLDTGKLHELGMRLYRRDHGGDSVEPPLKETTMEKNGNTFVPGDKVTTNVGAFGSNGKIAAQRGTGRVQPESSDGRMKVAWEDGTESWEKPEDLNRG